MTCDIVSLTSIGRCYKWLRVGKFSGEWGERSSYKRAQLYGQDSEYTRLTSLNEWYKDSSASERYEWLVKGNLPLHIFSNFFSQSSEAHFLLVGLFQSWISPIFIFCLHRKDSVLFFLILFGQNVVQTGSLTFQKEQTVVWSVRPFIFYRQGFQKLHFFLLSFALFKYFYLSYYITHVPL